MLVRVVGVVEALSVRIGNGATVLAQTVLFCAVVGPVLLVGLLVVIATRVGPVGGC